MLAWGAAIHFDLQRGLEAGDAVVCGPLDRLDTQLGGDLAREPEAAAGVVELAVAAEWLGTELEGELPPVAPFCAVELKLVTSDQRVRAINTKVQRVAELKPVDDVKKGRAVEGEQVALDVKRTLAGHHLKGRLCPFLVACVEGHAVVPSHDGRREHGCAVPFKRAGLQL